MASIADRRLTRALGAIKVDHSGKDFISDPCSYAKATIALIEQKLGRRYNLKISGYEFAGILNGDRYFTIERFKSAELAKLTTVAAGLLGQKRRSLPTEADTHYELFQDGDNLILMTSLGGDALRANRELFRQFQQAFVALH